MTVSKRRWRLGRFGLSLVVLAAVGTLGFTLTPDANAIVDGGPGTGERSDGSGGYGGSDSTAWVAKQWTKSGVCSAAFLNDGFAITAKHCFKNSEFDQEELEPGLVRLSVYRSGGRILEFDVNRVYAQPDHDIALVRISGAKYYAKDDPVDPRPQPFQLTWDEAPETGTGVIFGFGRTCHEGCKSDTTLRAAGVSVKRWQTHIQVQAAEVELQDGDVSVRYPGGNCSFGDSGGPLVVDGAIVGVSSKFYGDMSCGYARIDLHMAWILDVMGF